ncbi:uncharacterized protein ARMOST_18995 [Armillaria ostoyae]|uniref:Uncharacterized protein n=1 Tax=Armillaria ostoyae TaxID=47428 RepID=A0A284S3E0_ARMOS|nr:uncharacterized protein ARMOST_18995 [Armillaria ostoyae]
MEISEILRICPRLIDIMIALPGNARKTYIIFCSPRKDPLAPAPMDVIVCISTIFGHRLHQYGTRLYEPCIPQAPPYGNNSLCLVILNRSDYTSSTEDAAQELAGLCLVCQDARYSQDPCRKRVWRIGRDYNDTRSSVIRRSYTNSGIGFVRCNGGLLPRESHLQMIDGYV